MDRRDTREDRAEAAGLFAWGVSRAEVARRLGVSRATASRWHERWAREGPAALVAGRRRGRPPKLEAAELAAVDAALARPPRESGFDLDRWSLAAVARLVERLTGVAYHRRHVGRLLRRLGWTFPPVGATASFARRERAFADADGNVLRLVAPNGKGAAPPM